MFRLKQYLAETYSGNYQALVPNRASRQVIQPLQSSIIPLLFDEMAHFLRSPLPILPKTKNETASNFIPMTRLIP